MSTLPADTTEDAARAQREAWSRLGPSGKILLALQMSDDVRELAIEGEMRRTRLPRAQATRNVIRRMLGEALYEAAYGGR